MFWVNQTTTICKYDWQCQTGGKHPNHDNESQLLKYNLKVPRICGILCLVGISTLKCNILMSSFLITHLFHNEELFPQSTT
jgi:hypothetical protein